MMQHEDEYDQFRRQECKEITTEMFHVDLLVIHDDIVLDFGKVRIRRGGQDAGNNGLKSLHQHIGQAFWHVRIGADNLRRRQIGDVDFVLSEFNRDEGQILAEWTAPTVARAIDQFIAGAISATSYRLP